MLLCLLPFSAVIFEAVAAPFVALLPPDARLIATKVAAPVLTPLKATLYVALFMSVPAGFYHGWRLLAPLCGGGAVAGVARLVLASIILFYVGAAFAFFFVLPLMLGFFVNVAPEGVLVMPDIGAYLSFVAGTLVAFGIAFQVPVVTIVLVWSGVTSLDVLRGLRPYVFLGAFVVGMFLTPPDVFSQTLLAIPMYLLYELAILYCRWLLPAAQAVKPGGGEDAPRAIG